MKKYKIAIITAVWKRPEVFAMFARNVHRLSKDFDIVCCVAGSERSKSEAMVKDQGFDYVEWKNPPLGQKMNRAAMLAAKHNPDYCLMMGSDDLISPELLRNYLKHIEDYIYVTDGYFYDLESKRALYWAGYNRNLNRGHALGAGRFMSRNLMDQLNWQPWLDDRLHNLLDTSMDKRLAQCKYTKRALKCISHGLLVDVKSPENMTKFQRWTNTEYINSRVILKEFGEDIYNGVR